jgi:hypothetical protein
MNPQIHVSVAQESPYKTWFRECVVERPEPVFDAFHIAELRVLAAERLGTKAADLTIMSWRRLEDQEPDGRAG